MIEEHLPGIRKRIAEFTPKERHQFYDDLRLVPVARRSMLVLLQGAHDDDVLTCEEFQLAVSTLGHPNTFGDDGWAPEAELEKRALVMSLCQALAENHLNHSPMMN